MDCAISLFVCVYVRVYDVRALLCCPVVFHHDEFITFISPAHISLPSPLSALQNFFEKTCPTCNCSFTRALLLCSFRHKKFHIAILETHLSSNTHTHTHTHTHKHRKKKRNKRGARDITLIVAMNSTPLPTSREYVLCVLTLLICFFLNRSHPPPPCFYFCIRIESHIYNVLTNFFSLINRNNNSGVTIEGEDITQTISFQTPVVGGSNNNNSRVPLHSVVVRFF